MPAVHFLDPARHAEWDACVDRHPRGHFTHTSAWMSFMAEQGCPADVLAFGEPEIQGGMALYRHRSRIPPATFFYAPRGALVDYQNAGEWTGLLTAIRERAAARGAAFLQTDPDIDVEDAGRADILRQAGFQRPPHPSLPGLVQPQYVMHLPLAGRSEEALLDSFASPTRRGIRKAAKQGVTVGPPGTTDEEFREFYRIYQALGEARHFFYRSRSYVESMWRHLAPAGRARVFSARLGHATVAALLVIHTRRKTWLMYGGLDPAHKELRANNLLHWEVMRWALRQGHDWLSFRGVAGRNPAPTNEGYGIYRFKQGFSPVFHEWIGTLHQVYRPTTYAWWMRSTAATQKTIRFVRDHPRLSRTAQSLMNWVSGKPAAPAPAAPPATDTDDESA